MKGIITGIGNEITPEIDAVINEYIVGKNTILKGLELNGNILSAGTCILCGYRGTLENSQTVDGNYVYGKFVIGVNETDSFSIITSSNSTEPTDGIINPTSITSAGTYYLRLYANGVSKVDSERYPKQADTSDRARDLIAGGTIDSTATTPTEKNDLGEVVVNLHETQPNRVANTEYVHSQIQEELRYEGVVEGAIYMSGNISGDPNRIKLSLQRKAWYVVCNVTYNSDMSAMLPYLRVNFPNGYKPRYNNVAISFPYVDYTEGKYKVFFGTIIANVDGTVSAYFSWEKHSYSTLNEATNKAKTYVFRTGYECQ